MWRFGSSRASSFSSEGAEASGLLVPENSLAQIYLRGAADAQGQFPGESHADSMRLIALTFDAVVTSRQAGALAPDLLGLTIRSLASPELPHTADVARFAVMLSLRARYSVRYLASTTVLLRAAYDSVRRRLDDSQRTVTSLECFLMDVLCCEGWARRGGNTTSLEDRQEYYRSFTEHAFGIDNGGLPQSVIGRRRAEFLANDPPDFGEVLNIMFAKPTAIPGMDVAMGGLLTPLGHSAAVTNAAETETNVGQGHVTLLSGTPGAGKTTISLLLATRLAELGSQVRYIATEESARALEAKASTLTQSLREGFRNVVAATDVEPNDVRWIPIGGTTSLAQIATALEREFSMWASAERNRDKTPATVNDVETASIDIPVPYVVIVDSLSALLMLPASDPKRRAGLRSRAPRAELSHLLMRLRDVGVWTLLVSSASDREQEGLDYLVDTALAVSFEDDADDRHQTRFFSVEKTRLQRSNRGKHVLHLGSTHGASISPSLSAVLRGLRGRPEVALDEQRVAVLYSPYAQEPSAQIDESPLATDGALEIADHSQTFVVGQHAVGKAIFSLALAFEPRVQKHEQNGDYQNYLETFRRSPAALDPTEAVALTRARILIVSFLHDQAYYLDIVQRVMRTRFGTYERGLAENAIDVLCIRPGYADPEWFIGTLHQRLQAAELTGHRYRHVIFDAVHNALYQTPSLQREPLLWPTVLRMLRVRGLNTTVTMSYTSAMGSARTGSSGVSGFKHFDTVYHTFMSASDYVLELSRGDQANHIALGINVAPRHAATRQLIWDTDTLLMHPHTRSK